MHFSLVTGWPRSIIPRPMYVFFAMCSTLFPTTVRVLNANMQDIDRTRKRQTFGIEPHLGQPDSISSTRRWLSCLQQTSTIVPLILKSRVTPGTL